MHLRKSTEFSNCNPTVEWRRRKALTLELNELVGEMSAKADQIYALCDVNQEFRTQAQGRFTNVGDATEDLIRSLNMDLEH